LLVIITLVKGKRVRIIILNSLFIGIVVFAPSLTAMEEEAVEEEIKEQFETFEQFEKYISDVREERRGEINLPLLAKQTNPQVFLCLLDAQDYDPETKTTHGNLLQSVKKYNSSIWQRMVQFLVDRSNQQNTPGVELNSPYISPIELLVGIAPALNDLIEEKKGLKQQNSKFKEEIRRLRLQQSRNGQSQSEGNLFRRFLGGRSKK